MQMVEKYGLTQINPADAEKYFPDGQVTAEGWVSLLASMAYTESGFDPHVAPFIEPSGPAKGKASLGLFGVSTHDPEAISLGYTTRELLEDPYHNIEVAVKIMARQIRNNGTIQSSNNPYWGPLNRDEVFK
jgi:hypothetical protein